MPANSHPVMDAPVRSIRLVDELTRTEAVRFRSASPPGHLLHLVEAGHVEQNAEGRLEILRPGDLVWYHQSEPVEGLIRRAPWRFITVNFIAPGLPPPPDDRRVVRASPRTVHRFRTLLQAWRDLRPDPAVRALRCLALLNELLADLLPARPGTCRTTAPADALTERWWTVEKLLRQRLDQPVRLADMARLAGLSVRTAVRACHAATGLPPGRRLKAIRLNHARNLLQLTDLPITEIALAVGYERVQELSRDMGKHYGQTPRAVRATNRDYTELEMPARPISTRGPRPARAARRGG